MQARGTLGNEALGKLERVTVAALIGEIPFAQPDRPPAAEVDRTEELHQIAGTPARAPASSTKLASMASPSVPDFSGWNWVPHTGPCSTAAVSSPP